jgi:hypothetical protein
MKKSIMLASALLAVTAALASGPSAYAAHHSKKMKATTYQCQKCHMKMSAATAKKDHYKDPMDGGKLVPVKPMSSNMGGMKM